MAHTAGIDTQVLIVGAGPVGLAMSHMLRARGVDVVTVEKRVRRATQPKAKFINVRTMCILRTLGLADAVRDAAPFPSHKSPHVHYVPSLTDEPMDTVQDAFPLRPTRDSRYAEQGARLPQPAFEAVLEATLRERGHTVMRGWELTGLAGQEDSVFATLQSHDGDLTEVRASYVVGADGARSTVRHLLGSSFEGEAGVARSIGAVFRAPTLADAVVAGPGVHYWVINKSLPATLGFGALDTDGTWFVQAMGVDEGTPSDDTFVANMIRTAIGADIEFDLLDVERWVIHDMQARSYGSARTFIVGDAAHLHPPTGGFGMNMGIGDAFDLTWKLAAMLAGLGHRSLLDTYEQERRPVHRTTMDQAMANFRAVDLRLVDRVNGAASGDGSRYFDSLGLQLGYSYAGSPIICTDAIDASADDASAATPGRLLPHHWMPDDTALQDQLGSWFTLITHNYPPSAAAFEDAAALLNVPLRVLDLTSTVERASLGAHMLLIRPDHHIAWRGDECSRPSDVLKTVLGHQLEPAASDR